MYRFFHRFDVWPYAMLSDEEKIRIAKEKAAIDLAKALLEDAEFKITENGNCVSGVIRIGGD